MKKRDGRKNIIGLSVFIFLLPFLTHAQASIKQITQLRLINSEEFSYLALLAPGTQGSIGIIGTNISGSQILLKIGNRILSLQKTQILELSNGRSGIVKKHIFDGYIVIEIFELLNANQFVHLIGLYNVSSEPGNPSVRVVWDIDDTGSVEALVGGESIGVKELFLDLAEISKFALKANSTTIGLALLSASTFVRNISLVVGNSKRLLDFEEITNFKLGRGFTLLPFSLNDKALSYELNNIISLPGNSVWIGLQVGVLPLASIEMNAVLLPYLAAIQEDIFPNPGPGKEIIAQFKNLNQILSNINQALKDGDKSLGYREKLVESILDISIK